MDLSQAVLPLGTLLSVVGVAVHLGTRYGALSTRVQHLEARQGDTAQHAGTMVEVLTALAELKAEVRALRRDVDAAPGRRAG